MNLDILIKHLTWIVFFALALAGVYFTMKKIGVF